MSGVCGGRGVVLVVSCYISPPLGHKSEYCVLIKAEIIIISKCKYLCLTTAKCSNKIFNRTMTISGLELAWRMKNDGFPFMTSLQMIFFWSCFFGNVDQLRRYEGTRHQMADLPNVFTVH